MTEYAFNIKLFDFVGAIIFVRHTYGYTIGRLDFTPEKQQFYVEIEAAGARKSRVNFAERHIKGTPTFSEGMLRVELQ